MANLLELAGVISLKGAEIGRDYAARSGSQTPAYNGTDKSYTDCSDCNCDCSQGGDCDCTSAECEE